MINQILYKIIDVKNWETIIYFLFFTSNSLLQGQVGIGTSSPVTELQIYSPDESTTLTNFTQALSNGGLLIQTDYTANAYTPGIFWSTANDNGTKPKAGIFLRETATGTSLLFGTSNNYGIGVTNTSFQINSLGNTTIGNGVFYGESRLSLSGTDGNNDAVFTTSLEDGSTNPAFSILPWSSEVYLSSGIYYTNGVWAHHSDDTNNQLFVLDPGSGARWYASNNGSGSWNVTSNEALWDDGGNWKNLVQSIQMGDSYFIGGNIGIGTSSPTETLHLASSGSVRIRIQADTDDITETDQPQILFEQDGNNVNGLVGFSGGTNHLRIANNYVDPDGDIDFQTSGSTRMTVDGDGNIGIGTSSPTETLHLASSGSVRIRIQADTDNITETDQPQVLFEQDGNNVSGLVGFSGGTNHLRIANNYVDPDGDIDFQTSGSTRMTIDGVGNIGIGTTTPGGQLELSLDQGRKPGTMSWTVVSDERLKNITGIYTKGLDELAHLNPITYKYKNVEGKKFTDEVLETEFTGFTAQSVMKVFPEAVGTDADGYLNLNTHSIIIAYLNAIKELKQRIEIQRRDIEKLQRVTRSFKNELEGIKKILTKHNPVME